MSDSRKTDERLRSWLDTNQAARERLCLHLLPLLGTYTNVESRRPKGGRDSGRDIQAVFESTVEVWCAIGFKNTANDSREQKTWVKKKFKEDLKSAFEENSQLKGFVFFTNVDVTPAERRELTEYAANLGITHTDVFYRERLRQVLDSPDGLAYRLQYLDIEMSREEQLSFINNLQKAHEKALAALSQKQEEINQGILRLEFLNECSRLVYDVAVTVKLLRTYTTDELGHFRVIVKVDKIYEPSPWSDLLIGGRDSYMIAHGGDTDTKMFGVYTLIWATEPEVLLFSRRQISKSIKEIDTLRFRAPLLRTGPFTQFSEFDRTGFDIFVTDPLLNQLASISLAVNNFVLVDIPRSSMATAEEVGLTDNRLPEIPDPLNEVEKTVKWRRIYLRNRDTDNTDLPPPRRQASREIHFNERTPRRLPVPNQRGGTLWGSATMIIGS